MSADRKRPARPQDDAPHPDDGVNRAKPFRVVFRRFDGSDREYEPRYESAELAEAVARRFRQLGLEARVQTDAEIAKVPA
jgi:hypothetical protein